MFHRGEPLTETIWEKLMLGLTTRKYGEAVREFTEAYGLEKIVTPESALLLNRGMEPKGTPEAPALPTETLSVC
jgi:hypothetical protein